MGSEMCIRDRFIIAGNESYVEKEARGPCTMGIDVGSFLDVRISRVLAGKRVAVYIGRVNTPVSYTHLTLPTSDLV